MCETINWITHYETKRVLKWSTTIYGLKFFRLGKKMLNSVPDTLVKENLYSKNTLEFV
jgi:hypothetical protein